MDDAKAIKIGTLARTKLCEQGGRKLRKNWALGLIALSDDYLILFKETKPLQNVSHRHSSLFRSYLTPSPFLFLFIIAFSLALNLTRKSVSFS